MQRLHRNSALFLTPEKARVRSPLLIVSRRLALGTPENAGVAMDFRPLMGPRECSREVAIYNFLAALGVGDPPKCKG